MLLGLLSTGCGSGPVRPPQPEPVADAPARGEPIAILGGERHREIAVLEDRRTTGGGRLIEMLAAPDAGVRARAARALGRMPFPEYGPDVTDALARALEDPDPGVRLEAIFGLGVRGDVAAAGVLAAYRNDPDPRIRARVVEAAGRLDAPRLHGELLVALRDSALEVRTTVVEATALWSPDRADALAVDRALIDALSPYVLTNPSAGTRVREVETELAWRILYALARRHSTLGRGAFLEYAASTVPLERLFAIRGLAHQAADREVVGALARALSDPNSLGAPDWRVSYEATVSLRSLVERERALGRPVPEGGKKPLLRAAENDNVHTRAGAMAALGSYSSSSDVLPVLRRGLLDVSTEVQVAALGSIVRGLEPQDALHTLERAVEKGEPVLRAGAATAAAEIDGAEPKVIELLTRLVRDPDLRVAGAALEALARKASARPLLHEYLAHDDLGLRLAAVGALSEMPDDADVEPLIAAAAGVTGDGAEELTIGVLRNLAELGEAGNTRAREAVLSAVEDPRPYVAHVTRELMVGLGVTLPAKPPAPLDVDTPLVNEDYPRWKRNPLVEVRTTRGTMVFELFPAEAPLHVVNFLELAKAGYYDGLSFHRVVPDFVIQGGDYRGDGNGARPWRGEALRHEFMPHSYGRGALGMPRNENPDSGGSQFFVTHRPTPHLDGRYTLFGELRAGSEVLDRIEVGDRILAVRPRK